MYVRNHLEIEPSFMSIKKLGHNLVRMSSHTILIPRKNAKTGLPSFFPVIHLILVTRV